MPYANHEEIQVVVYSLLDLFLLSVSVLNSMWKLRCYNMLRLNSVLFSLLQPVGVFIVTEIDYGTESVHLRVVFH